MICPDCSHDNIAGVATCEACGQPLVDFDPKGTELEQVLSRHSIGLLCSKDPIAVPSSAPVHDAVVTMHEKGIGCVLVVDDSKLVGILTERDILNKLPDAPADSDQPVSQFMTASPNTVTNDDSIAYALHTMDLGGYRHVPVVDADEKPVGIVSSRDIVRYIALRFTQLIEK